MNSTKTTEELLNEHKRWKYIRTDRNGTRYFSDFTCHRCGGFGKLNCYAYIDGGTCWECGGSGVSAGTEVKVYTPEHEAKLAAQREARQKKAEAERYQKLLSERDSRLEKAGFAKETIDDTVEWVIYRVVGNTYSIKDELKEAGCKFNPAVGWYRSTPVDGHRCQRLTEKDVLADSPFIEWKSKGEVEFAWAENLEKVESKSEWQGEIGSRIEIKVTVNKAIPCSNAYGSSNLYTMTDEDGNIYKWFTAKVLTEGQTYHFRATVKDHSEYKGEKQTVITRAMIVKE